MLEKKINIQHIILIQFAYSTEKTNSKVENKLHSDLYTNNEQNKFWNLLHITLSQIPRS